MKAKPLPDLDLLRKRYVYDPETGTVTSVKTGKPITRTQGKYLTIKVSQEYYLLHRIIYLLMTDEDPGADYIDHINGDTLDNRWINLRKCTPSQNNWNRLCSGATLKPSGSYQVQIQANGITTYVGTYPTLEEAEAAYQAAATEQHGEYNRDIVASV